MDKKEFEKLRLSKEELKEIASGTSYPGDSFEMMLAHAYGKRLVQQYPTRTVEYIAEMLDYLLELESIKIDKAVLEQIVREYKIEIWGLD